MLPPMLTYFLCLPGLPLAHLTCLSALPFPTPGNIENTEKLQYSGEKLYKFTVTAYDCGKKRAADDAEVEIQVKPTCKPSWQGEALGGFLLVNPVVSAVFTFFSYPV